MIYDQIDRKSKEQAWKIGILISSAVILLLLVLAYILYVYNHNNNLEKVDLREIRELESQKAAFEDYFSHAEQYVTFLSNSHLVENILEDPTTQTEDYLENILYEIAKDRSEFEQYRLLDRNGQEVVRVNTVNGEVEIVPKELLQDKSRRYYFQYLKNQDQEENNYYLSPFDLNVENGVIEIPFNPTLRIGRRIVDASGQFMGALLLNVDGNSFFDLLAAKKLHEEDVIYILNENGYYVYHPDVDKRFAFMFDDRKDIGYFKDRPAVWQSIKNGESFYNSKDVRIYSQEYTVLSHASSGDANNRYYIVMEVPKTVVTEYDKPLTRSIMIVLIIIGPVLIFLSIFLGQQWVQNKNNKNKLVEMAMHDKMTGLFNRRAIFDEVRRMMAMSDRYHRASSVIFIDLDNLKYVNDNYGHQVGDEMILATAESLKSCVRSSDQVGRLGGDEFLCVLYECDEENAKEVVKRAGEMLQSKGLAMINMAWSLSYGIQEYRSGQELDRLIDMADQKMYQYKQQHKQQYQSQR